MEDIADVYCFHLLPFAAFCCPLLPFAALCCALLPLAVLCPSAVDFCRSTQEYFQKRAIAQIHQRKEKI